MFRRRYNVFNRSGPALIPTGEAAGPGTLQRCFSPKGPRPRPVQREGIPIARPSLKQELKADCNLLAALPIRVGRPQAQFTRAGHSTAQHSKRAGRGRGRGRGRGEGQGEGQGQGQGQGSAAGQGIASTLRDSNDWRVHSRPSRTLRHSDVAGGKCVGFRITEICAEICRASYMWPELAPTAPPWCARASCRRARRCRRVPLDVCG